uniref:Uncharacterized protein n=1 Tax=Oryza rufipogon TaxID=4529 RepID=A0A0E0RGT1_ORYRU
MFTSSFLIERSGFSRSNPTSQIAPTISSHGHTTSSPHPSLPSFTPPNRAPRSKSLLPIRFLTHNLALPLSRSTAVVSTRHWGHRLRLASPPPISSPPKPSCAATGALSTTPPVKSASIPRALPPAPSPPCRHQFVDPSRAATGFHPTASQVSSATPRTPRHRRSSSPPANKHSSSFMEFIYGWVVDSNDFPLPIALVEISGRCKTNDHGKKNYLSFLVLNLGDERTYGLVWVLETGGVAEKLMMNVVFFMGDGDLVVLVVGKIALVLSNMLYEDMKAGPNRVLVVYDQTS